MFQIFLKSKTENCKLKSVSILSKRHYCVCVCVYAWLCVCVCVIPVSIIGDKHSLSDLAFNFLVNYQQHDSIKVQSLTLRQRENRHNQLQE